MPLTSIFRPLQTEIDITLPKYESSLYRRFHHPSASVIYDQARGSQSLFWDANGKPIQYIHYAPYGELIANQQTIGYDEQKG